MELRGRIGDGRWRWWWWCAERAKGPTRLHRKYKRERRIQAVTVALLALRRRLRGRRMVVLLDGLAALAPSRKDEPSRLKHMGFWGGGLNDRLLWGS